MTNLWGVLLQTCSVSLVAGLLLGLKRVWKQTLSPRWQSALWGILSVRILFPVTMTGKFLLLPLPFWVETLKTVVEGHLSSSYTSFYEMTQVTAPIPVSYTHLDEAGERRRGRMTFLVQQTLIYAVPLMIVALAGVFAERSGIINLALEGIMIFGAFIGVLFVRTMQGSEVFAAAKAAGDYATLQGLEIMAMAVAALLGAIFSLLLSFCLLYTSRCV